MIEPWKAAASQGVEHERSKVSTALAVTFWGAARSVTGSMHLVEAGPYRLLLDCGLARGPRDEARLRNRAFPFDPSSIDAVVLSHAHVDHCGNLPNLVRQGFHGPIVCTPATRDLIAVMLADSARIHEDDASTHAALHGAVDASRAPLYTRADAARAVAQCVVVPYGKVHLINDDVQLTFHDAGHILGSAMARLTFSLGGRERSLTFTGDLGRRGLPFGREPGPVPPADLVISESTYGGRTHEPEARMAERLAGAVKRTVARGGKVLIPAFSLGRTQIVLHYLQKWTREGLLPRLPLYVDSPLAQEISAVYARHADALPPPCPDDTPPHFIDTPEQGREVSTYPEPCVIVASGGMCEGGRIVQHLRLHIDDPRTALVLVSYQAPQSLGARLLEKRPTVRFHGRTWNKWVEVAELNGFSGHADQNDFLALLGPAAGAVGRVRLVHGEPEQAEALAASLRRAGFADVGVPSREDSVTVSS